MPRYFFHTRISDQLIWDTTGLELPEIARPDDPELTSALWSEAFDKHLNIGRDLVVTNVTGKVVFVTAF
jgi:hypothetical protein